MKFDKDRNVAAFCCCKLPGLSMPEFKVIEACQAIDTFDRKVLMCSINCSNYLSVWVNTTSTLSTLLASRQGPCRPVFKKCPPRGSVRVRTPPCGSVKSQDPALWVRWGQEYGLMPVFKKCPPCGSVRVRTPPRGSVRVRTPPPGSLRVRTLPCGSDRVRSTG